MSGGWDAMEKRGRYDKTSGSRPLDDEQRRQELESLAQKEMARLCARVFGTPDGLSLLRRLREMTKDRVCGPAIGESALVWIEGQRFLVHQIETWCAHGRREDPSDFRDALTRD